MKKPLRVQLYGVTSTIYDIYFRSNEVVKNYFKISGCSENKLNSRLIVQSFAMLAPAALQATLR